LLLHNVLWLETKPATAIQRLL